MKLELNATTLVIALFVVLVVMAGVQAVQLSTLAQAVSSGAVSTGAAAQQSVLSQLPTQVGGC